MNHERRRRPHVHPREPAEAMTTDHHQIGILGRIEQASGGRTWMT